MHSQSTKYSVTTKIVTFFMLIFDAAFAFKAMRAKW